MNDFHKPFYLALLKYGRKLVRCNGEVMFEVYSNNGAYYGSCRDFLADKEYDDFVKRYYIGDSNE